jgi:hypothetical protein
VLVITSPIGRKFSARVFNEISLSLVAHSFQNLVDGDGSGGSAIGVSGMGNDGGSDGLNVVVTDDGSSLDTLDDWLTSNWGGDSVWDRLGNMDSGGDLNNLLDWLDDIIGDIVGPGNFVGLVDNVGLLLDSDNGGVDLGGSTKSSWDSNVKIGDCWLEDLSGIAGDVGGLSQVNLLADLSGCLVDGGDRCADNGRSAVWGRDCNWGSSNCNWGSSNGSAVGGSSQDGAGWGSTASSGEESKDDL